MDSPQKGRPDPGWLHHAGVRVRWCWPVKMLGTAFGMTAFFVAYFWVLRHPLHPPAIVPLTAVDRLIGFWPQTLPLYFSLWVYVSLAPALLINRRELMAYSLTAAGLGVVGLGIFLLWPTAVPTFDVDWSRHPSLAFLKSVDASGNVCPSLHVAYAVFTAAWLEHLLRQMGTGRLVRALNSLWCLGILLSTMAIRQHVWLDVLAGAALGATAALVPLRSLRAHPRPPCDQPPGS